MEKLGLLYRFGMAKNNILLARFGERRQGKYGCEKVILKKSVLKLEDGGSRARSAKALCTAYSIPITDENIKTEHGFTTIDEVFEKPGPGHLAIDNTLRTIPEETGGYDSES